MKLFLKDFKEHMKGIFIKKIGTKILSKMQHFAACLTRVRAEVGLQAIF
jgi:hypothetical protein